MSNLLKNIIKKPEPSFERILNVINGSSINKIVPLYELFVDIEIMEALIGERIEDSQSTVKFYHSAGYDYVPAWPKYKMVLGSFDTAVNNNPIRDLDSFEAYLWPKLGSVSFNEFEKLIPLLPDGMKIIGQTGGIFEMLEMLMGYENMCYMLYDSPELVDEILEKVMVLYREMYNGMAAIPEVGAIVISDDLGHKTQTLISPEMLKKYILPRHKELADIIHASGKPCIYHSCGQIYDIIDCLINEVKIDAKHSFEDVIMPVEKAYAKYGNRISILGGLDIDILTRGTKEEVVQKTYKLVTELGYSGRYAIGSGNSIASYVPIENYLAMIETAWKLRGY